MRFGTVTSRVIPTSETEASQTFRATIRILGAPDSVAWVKVGDLRKVVVEALCAELAEVVGLPVPAYLVVQVPVDDGRSFIYGFASEYEGNDDLTFHFSGRGDFTSPQFSWVLHLPEANFAGAFDEWIGNNDRHVKNVLLSGSTRRVKFIDHAAALKTTNWTTDPIANNRFLHDIKATFSASARENLANEIMRTFLARIFASAPWEVVDSLEMDWMKDPHYAGAMAEMLEFRMAKLAEHVRTQLGAGQGVLDFE